MSSATNEAAPIYSTLGGDPDLGELVEMYVDEMPERIASLEQAFSNGDQESLQSLKRAAHQLKGAGESYGFSQLTPLAAAVEYSVRDGEPEEAIFNSLKELVAVCKRVRSGIPE